MQLGPLAIQDSKCLSLTYHFVLRTMQLLFAISFPPWAPRTIVLLEALWKSHKRRETVWESNRNKTKPIGQTRATYSEGLAKYRETVLSEAVLRTNLSMACGNHVHFKRQQVFKQWEVTSFAPGLQKLPQCLWEKNRIIIIIIYK